MSASYDGYISKQKSPEEIYRIWAETGVFFCNISKPLKNTFPVGSAAYDYCYKANRFYYTNQVKAHTQVKKESEVPKEVTLERVGKVVEKLMATRGKELYTGKIKPHFFLGNSVSAETQLLNIDRQYKMSERYVDDLCLTFQGEVDRTDSIKRFISSVNDSPLKYKKVLSTIVDLNAYYQIPE